MPEYWKTEVGITTVRLLSVNAYSRTESLLWGQFIHEEYIQNILSCIASSNNACHCNVLDDLFKGETYFVNRSHFKLLIIIIIIIVIIIITEIL